MICADTSFLLSYYGEDTLSERARAHRPTVTEAIYVHSFSEFELANALRLLVFRKKITEEQLEAWMASFEADKREGILIVAEVDANAVICRAEILSAAHTQTGGNRAYDILHIAAAKILGATEFWSFDGKQRALADAEGLAIGP
jgi:predicted nucleic acid-binding protein